MISGRWKLPILFRLFAKPSIRTSHFLRDIPDISQKMLTQHLRELENDGLVVRRDFGEQPPRVEYGLTDLGRGLMPVLMSMREFSRQRPEKTS
jgi:DNA-binding HxlR family transcriptional regulator